MESRSPAPRDLALSFLDLGTSRAGMNQSESVCVLQPVKTNYNTLRAGHGYRDLTDPDKERDRMKKLSLADAATGQKHQDQKHTGVGGGKDTRTAFRLWSLSVDWKALLGAKACNPKQEAGGKYLEISLEREDSSLSLRRDHPG